MPINTKEIKEAYKNNQISQFLIQQKKIDIETFIQKASNSYYNEENEIISDEEFDSIIDYVKKKYKNSQVLKQVGSLPQNNKVKLPYFLGSLNKLKSQNELNNWIKKFNVPNSYVISDKLDGMSCLYHNGSLLSRGSGHWGGDITHMKAFVQGIPKTNKNIQIRGELIISKKDFSNFLSQNFKNPRNSVVGIVNAKKTNQDQAKFINFIGYQLFTDDYKNLEEQLQIINLNNFQCVHYNILNKEQIKSNYLSQYLINRKKECQFEIDGSVIAHNQAYPIQKKDNPKNMFAWKYMSDEDTQLTKVIDVTYNISKDAVLVPTVHIQPVQILGTTIKNVTAHNIDYVIKNKIGPNAIIRVFKAGEIIPSIKEVVQQVEPKLPNQNLGWHFNETKKNAVLDKPFENEEYNFRIIENFFSVFKIPYFREQTIKQLYENGYNTIPKILTININQLQQIPSFKSKKSYNVYNSIHDIFDKPIDLVKLIVASNQLKRGFSQKTVQDIIDKNPNLKKNIYEFDIEKIQMPDGVLKKQLIQNWQFFLDFMKLNNFNQYE